MKRPYLFTLFASLISMTACFNQSQMDSRCRKVLHPIDLQGRVVYVNDKYGIHKGSVSLSFERPGIILRYPPRVTLDLTSKARYSFDGEYWEEYDNPMFGISKCDDQACLNITKEGIFGIEEMQVSDCVIYLNTR